jgi:5-formyltetrahydrofolate cyclo-ligase
MQSRSDDGPVPSAAVAKIALRDRISTMRHRRSLLEIGDAARGLAEVVMARPEVRRAATVAAYVSIGSEPGTGPLLDALTAAGKRVILPVVLPDLDLDWGTWRGSTALMPARRGLLEPADRLGLDAIATADLVLAPGSAVSGAG